MPPEKKKKLAQHSDDSEDAEIHKTYEEEDSSARTQQSSGAKEAIKFDEYMEGGIPDSLLKGLGFSESGQPSADDGSEAEAEPAPNDSSFLHKDHASGNEDEGADEEDNGGDDAEDEDYYERAPPRVVAKRKRGRPPGKSTPRGLKNSSPGRSRTGGKSPGSHAKAIIRGNIMYERTETGEVIASLIRNGPNDGEGGKTFPGRLDGYPADSRGSGSSGSAVLNELPSNCPIDENNVEDILNRSIEETNTMRMLLATLKDDLRRMGGGPNMTPYLKPVHVKRRTEIAEQLLKVYCNYQTNINNISKMSRNPLSHVFPGNWTPVERRASPSIRAPRGGRGARRAVPVETPSPGTQATSAAAKRQTPVNNDGAVSNDLWMSCEPGSDDEGVARKGGIPKRKKQCHSQDKSPVGAQID